MTPFACLSVGNPNRQPGELRKFQYVQPIDSPGCSVPSSGVARFLEYRSDGGPKLPPNARRPVSWVAS